MMKIVLKNALALIVGWIVGAAVNMALVKTGHALFPLPEGVDGNDMEQLKEAMKSFAAIDFLFPLLAHALGTLVGAFTAAKLAASHPMKFAYAIGLLFLLGGIMMVALVGGPIWFIVLDLALAYLPMAYLGGKLGRRKN